MPCNSFMIHSPMAVVDISLSVDSCRRASRRSTMCSIASTGMGRFSQAFLMPEMIFIRSNGSRRPSFLQTCGSISSTRSWVVKRLVHSSHSRRRRMAVPPLSGRESITLLSGLPQNGHFMVFRLFSKLGVIFCAFQAEITSLTHLSRLLGTVGEMNYFDTRLRDHLTGQFIGIPLAVDYLGDAGVD